MKPQLNRMTLACLTAAAAFCAAPPPPAQALALQNHAVLGFLSASLASVEIAPSLPAPLQTLAQPVVRATSVGYLPMTSDVGVGGDFRQHIPIEVAPGRAGMAPSLSLEYSSNGTNGLMGMGWTLGGLSSITRCSQTLTGQDEGVVIGVKNDATDHFCLDGKKLVAVQGAYGANGTEYRKEDEDFTKVVQQGVTTSGPQGFRIWTKDGLIHDYVAINAAKFQSAFHSVPASASPTQKAGYAQDPSNLGDVPVVWVLDKTSDRSGNSIRYHYLIGNLHLPYGDALEYVPERIDYTENESAADSDVRTAQRSVVFHYDNDRSDVVSTWQAGVNYQVLRRLTSIEIQGPNPTTKSKLREYKFEYKQSASSGRSLLTSVQLCGELGGCLWAKQFTWNEPAAPTFTPQLVGPAPLDPNSMNGHLPDIAGFRDVYVDPSLKVADLDGDGTDDILYWLGYNTGYDRPDVPPTPIPSTSLQPYVRWGGSAATGKQPLTHLAAANSAGSAYPANPLFPGAQGVVSAGFWPYIPDLQAVDIDGDGSTEFLATYKDPSDTSYPVKKRFLHWNSITGVFDDVGYIDPAVYNEVVNFVDVDGDHLPDMLNQTAGANGVSLPEPPFPGSFFGWGVYPPNSEFGVFVNDPGGFALHYNLGGVGTFGPQILPTTEPDAYYARVRDLDGDGRGDVTFYGMAGSSTIGNSALSYGPDNQLHARTATVNGAVTTFLANPSQAGYIFLVGDFNGDGLADELLLPSIFDTSSNAWRCGISEQLFDCTPTMMWNTGNGYVVDSRPLDIPRDAQSTLRVADVDGDGRDDLVSFHDNQISIERSRGDGSFVRSDITANPGPVIPDVGRPFSVTGDFNGDGRTDLLTHDGANLQMLLQDESYADRISQTNDESSLYPRQIITYSNEWSDYADAQASLQCAYPLKCLKKGLMVVREIDSFEHITDAPNLQTLVGEANRVYYSYSDPVEDLRSGFLGFAEMDVWNATAGTESKTRYDNRRMEGGRFDFAGYPSSVTVATPIVDGLPAIGVAYQTSQPWAHVRVSKVDYTNDLRAFNGGKTRAVVTTSATSKEWEQLAHVDTTAEGFLEDGHVWPIIEPSGSATATSSYGNGWLRRQTRAASYDDFGNRTSQTIATDSGTREDVTTVFDNRVADWLVSLPVSQTLTVTEADPAVLPVTRRSARAYDTLGRIASLSEEPGSTDPSLQSAATFDIDDIGLLRSVTRSAPGALTQVTHFEYDSALAGAPAERVFPSQVWASHDVASKRPSLWIATAPMGHTLAEIDANGVLSHSQYDDLGRLTSVVAPADAPTTMTYGPRNDAFGGSNGLVMTVAQGSASVQASMNVLGSTLSVLSQDFAGAPIHEEQTYDRLGRLLARTVPSADPLVTASRTTQYTYDSLGRLRKTSLPDGSTSSQAYTYEWPNFVTESIDANHDTSRMRVDVNGRLVQSENDLGTTGTVLKTVYQYAPFDLLWRVTDDKGNVTTALYDARGRKTGVVDPDRGQQTIGYNGLNQLTSIVQVTGAHEEYVYDDLGRKIARNTESGGSDTFVWDDADHAIGHLTSTTSADDIETDYAYDQNSRLAEVAYADLSNGHRYRVSYEYSANVDRLTSMLYPDVTGRGRLRIAYGYTSAGAVNEVSDATVSAAPQMLAQIAARNSEGSPLTTKLGNGVQIDNQYYPATGRLAQSVASTTSAQLSSLVYSYDALGLLKTRDDAVNRRYESFAYDSVMRLGTWCLAGDLTEGRAQCQEGDPTLTRYAYDSIGNLTDILAGNGAKKYTYDIQHPHAVVDVMDVVANTHETYGYDDRGRQKNAPGRTIEFNAFDLPRTITEGGQSFAIAYDALGERVKKSGPGVTTFYVPGLFERRETAAGTTDVYHVAGPDGAVADITFDETTTATTTAYLLQDHLGTAHTIVDEHGSVLEHAFYDPFGERIEANGLPFAGQWASHDGFTGQEHDVEFGLENFKGRMYDAHLKRFLSPDPLVSFASFGQSWNPYSYVLNSPLNLTDPSGFAPEEGDGKCGPVDYPSPCGGIGSPPGIGTGNGASSGFASAGGVGPGGLPSGGLAAGAGVAGGASSGAEQKVGRRRVR